MSNEDYTLTARKLHADAMHAYYWLMSGGRDRTDLPEGVVDEAVRTYEAVSESHGWTPEQLFEYGQAPERLPSGKAAWRKREALEGACRTVLRRLERRVGLSDPVGPEEARGWIGEVVAKLGGGND